MEKCEIQSSHSISHFQLCSLLMIFILKWMFVMQKDDLYNWNIQFNSVLVNSQKYKAIINKYRGPSTQ